MKAQKVLASVRAKRGYVLGYHRLMAAADPELLAAYDAFYTRFTLASRALSDVEKETVWIALIIATRAKIGTLHFARARKAGMTKDAIADAAAIGAVCIDGFLFMEYFKVKSEKTYLRTFEAARGKTRPALAELAGAVANAGTRRTDAMVLHLQRAFRKGMTRAKAAEALTYCLLHCGGPTMVEAVGAWERAARRRRLPAPY